MSWRPSRPRSNTPSLAAGELEVDVTPVMNMFIILIPFLVGMAVFSHLAVHAFTLPADEGPGRASLAEDLPLTVAVAVDRVVVARGGIALGTAPRGAAGYDLAALSVLLAEARRSLPGVARVVVAVDDPVVCDDVGACLDRCRDAGVADVGLASGTDLDRGEEAAR